MKKDRREKKNINYHHHGLKKCSITHESKDYKHKQLINIKKKSLKIVID